MSKPKILLISLGGTITMTRDVCGSGGVIPTLTAADLAAAAPGIEAVANIETVSPLTVPSASLTMDDLLTVAERLNAALLGDIAGAVVIQGTDTIEETAFVLDRLVQSDKPVVVTGAMRSPQEASADGPRNVLSSVTVAAAPDAGGRGLLVVLNDEINAGRFVQKTHTALSSAFRSPTSGPVGFVIEGEARFHARTERGPRFNLPLSSLEAPVALIKVGLDDDGRLLSALPSLGFAGAVIEAMGAGHVPAPLAPIVSDLVRHMPVVLASRVTTGPVFSRTYGFPGSEMDLLARGAVSAGSLTALKARLLLLLLLRAQADRDAIAASYAAFR